MTSANKTTLSEYLPEGPITSLRRIQALYGALEEGLGGDDTEVDPEFALYYTPGELDEFTTTDPSEKKRYLITVEVDLAGESVTADEVDIDVDFLTPELVDKLGFSRFPWGRGIDHSITRRGAKGGSTANTVTNYCIDCLQRWTDADGREPAVGDVAETHPDGWVISLLQELGADEEVHSRIEELVSSRYTDDERVVTTVRLQLDPTDLEEYPDGDKPNWYYPGEVHVLNAAMKARKDLKLANKNLSDGVYSIGESACMVTGERDEVFGTAEDPLAFFTIQHAEKFNEIKRRTSWRDHPISSNAALLIQSGASLVESCRTTRNGLGVYALPYFVDMTEERAEMLHLVLEKLRDYDDTNDTHPMYFLEDGIKREGTEEDVAALRFYVISLRNDSGDINVVHEAPDVSLYWPRKIARSHYKTLHESSAFSSVGFEKIDGWTPISPNTDADTVVNEIVSGRYAWGTMPKMAGDDGAMADDQAEWLTYALLTGESIPVEQLLNAYVDRLEQERRDNDDNGIPDAHIRSQFAQLEALARAGLVSGDGASNELTRPPKTMSKEIPTKAEVADDGDLSRIDVRRYRLETFIDDRESLAQNSERQSAFLIGVLVGMTSHHQQNTRRMNRTVVDEYPPDRITIDRLVNIWPELVHKSTVYAKDVDWAGETLFPELLDQETDVLTYPKDWTLPLQDVRFFYALGVTYGLRADSRAYELRQQIEANESGSHAT